MATVAIGIAPSSGKYSCRVPLSAISESGVPPEEGDQVQFEVTGTVHNITGDSCTVDIDSINGEPIQGGGSSEAQASNEPLPPENATAMGIRLKKAARGLPMPRS
jgi:hypothetical protein